MTGVMPVVVVFSAHAEVVPARKFRFHWLLGILRARGGSSALLLNRIFPGWYSPRTRR